MCLIGRCNKLTELINLTGLQNVTTAYDILVYANSVTGQFVGFMLLIGIMLIVLFALMRRGYAFKDCLLPASFAGFIIGLFLRYIGFISAYYLLFVLIVVAISAFLHIRNN